MSRSFTILPAKSIFTKVLSGIFAGSELSSPLLISPASVKYHEGVRNYHRPVLFDSRRFANTSNTVDFAERLELAHNTAWLLVSRMREQAEQLDDSQQEQFERLLEYINTRGITELTELWASIPKPSLPNLLARIDWFRNRVRKEPELHTLAFNEGVKYLDTIDPVVAGVAIPSSLEEFVGVFDQILGGIFLGDFESTLYRSSALLRITSRGLTELSDGSEHSSPERFRSMQQMSLRYLELADDLRQGAKLWREGELA